MHYKESIILADNVWNNAFSFDQRASKLGHAQITIPCLQEITSVDEINLWDEIVFEEIDHNWQIRSCKGLEHIYKLSLPNLTTPIYIFDNHNHALYFWSLYASSIKKGEGIKLIHIDQHSDLKAPPYYMGEHENALDDQGFINTTYVHPEEITNDDTQRREYTNFTCNVWNFIMPFLKAFPFTSFQRIKAEDQLLWYDPNLWLDDTLLLDIDLDFRAPEMNAANPRWTINKTKALMKEASLITIATSPYFLNQTEALGLLHELLT